MRIRRAAYTVTRWMRRLGSSKVQFLRLALSCVALAVNFKRTLREKVRRSLVVAPLAEPRAEPKYNASASTCVAAYGVIHGRV